MKKIIFLAIFFVIFSAFLFFFLINFSNDFLDNYSWTKAICNKTHCQDYEIICDGKEIVTQAPITGAVIKISDTLEDLRDEKNKKEYCD
jgi:hypothetical protein